MGRAEAFEGVCAGTTAMLSRATDNLRFASRTTASRSHRWRRAVFALRLNPWRLMAQQYGLVITDVTCGAAKTQDFAGLG
ncbi:hypothetical protein GCM10027599_12760 [Yimella radicis]